MELLPLLLLGFLSALSLTFGFLALLKQKNYMDASTGTVTVDVPFFGKLQTNFPALVFVLIGGGLGYYASTVDLHRTHSVRIDGQLKSTATPLVTDWSETNIAVAPSFDQRVDPSGSFTIKLEIPSTTSPKDYIEAVIFQYRDMSGRISRSADNTSRISKDTEAELSATVQMSSQ